LDILIEFWQRQKFLNGESTAECLKCSVRNKTPAPIKPKNRPKDFACQTEPPTPHEDQSTDLEISSSASPSENAELTKEPETGSDQPPTDTEPLDRLEVETAIQQHHIAAPGPCLTSTTFSPTSIATSDPLPCSDPCTSSTIIEPWSGQPSPFVVDPALSTDSYNFTTISAEDENIIEPSSGQSSPFVVVPADPALSTDSYNFTNISVITKQETPVEDDNIRLIKTVIHSTSFIKDELENDLEQNSTTGHCARKDATSSPRKQRKTRRELVIILNRVDETNPDLSQIDQQSLGNQAEDNDDDFDDDYYDEIPDIEEKDVSSEQVKQLVFSEVSIYIISLIFLGVEQP
jgi:hypothetical protein